MGKYKVIIEELANLHLQKHKKSGNQATLKKIDKIFKELTTTPFTGTGNPEQLKYQLSGKWSSKINQKDRLIYKVEENIVTVFVVSAMGHYGDK
jgi:toxin YoeB